MAKLLSSGWFPGSSPADLSTLLQHYPSDPAAGSPFDTGDKWAYSPQSKRLAALQGDWIFHAPRRLLLDKISPTRNAYNFCGSRSALCACITRMALTSIVAVSARGNFPGVGDVSVNSSCEYCRLPVWFTNPRVPHWQFHGSDLFNSLGGGDMGDYFIRFVRHLNPNANAASGVQWPPYKPSTRATLQFNEGSVPVNVTVDDQRLAGTQEITSLTLRFPA